MSIHPTADVAPSAEIGSGTVIWHQAQVCAGARIGANCILGKGVYVDTGVVIGDNVKIQNYVSIYHGVTLEDGVFCGPHCVFTNDRYPRAITPAGKLQTAADWEVVATLVGRGASLGANVTVVCGVQIGEWALIGAGSVVTRDVPAYGLAWGNPARLHGYVCSCGVRLSQGGDEDVGGTLCCPKCGREIPVASQPGVHIR
jgi:UDP-2-acetamido-3-amino-2,3-dideoxy-glucuronate N-acetyltransferase